MDGIGDYALKLAGCLRRTHGWQSDFVVGDPGWSGPPDLDSFPVSAVTSRTPAALTEKLAASGAGIILLHYGGYGYARRGTPAWLSGGLKLSLEKANAPRPALITCFHELWAFGPPWRSSFYLHLWQRWIVQQVQRLSDAAVTSTRRMQRLLQNGTSPPRLLPIPSNVIDVLPPIPAKAPLPRKFRAALFGQTGPRLRTARAHRKTLLALQNRGALDQVTVLGQGACGPPGASADVRELQQILPADRIKVLGSASAAAIQAEMSRADFYLSFYPASLACKSTTFMTALACGCPPILPRGRDAEPLEPGKHFLACDGSPAQVAALMQGIAEGLLSRVAREGQDWYRLNAHWPVITEGYQEILASLAR